MNDPSTAQLKKTEQIRAVRHLTKLLGKLGIAKDLFLRETNQHIRQHISGPPSQWFGPIYGLSVKESKDWVDRYLAQRSS